MGIDKRQSKPSKKRTTPSSTNPYLRVLVKIYRFLARRATCPFNKVILKRLMMSRINRPPCSTSKLALSMRHKVNKENIVVVVGDVTNDNRRIFIPKMKVCALRFTKMARKSIEAAGGECMTFDQLALLAPKGSKCTLIRGKKSHRKEVKHYGAPGTPGSHAAPKMGNRYAHMHGRKHEQARGRRKSRAWKVKA